LYASRVKLEIVRRILDEDVCGRFKLDIVNTRLSWIFRERLWRRVLRVLEEDPWGGLLPLDTVRGYLPGWGGWLCEQVWVVKPITAAPLVGFSRGLWTRSWRRVGANLYELGFS
jgi:hypothetical protein